MAREVPVVLQFLESRGFHGAASLLREESGNCNLPSDASILERALDLFFSTTQPGAKPVEFPGPGNFWLDETCCLPDIFEKSNPTAVAWKPELGSELVVVGSATGQLKVISTNTGDVVVSGQTPTPVLSVSWSVSGWIAATCMGGEVLFMIDSDLSRVVNYFRHHGHSHVLGSAFSRPGNFFFTFGRDSTLACYQLVNGEWSLHHVFRFPKNVGAACWLDDDVLAVAVHESHCLFYFSASAKIEIGRSHLNTSLKDFSCMAVPLAMTSWGGRFVAVALSAMTTRIYEFCCDCPLRSFYGSKADEYDKPQISFSIEGSFIVISDGSDLCGFQTQSQQKSFEIAAHAQTVRAMSRHPTEDRYASVSFDKCLKVFS